MFFPFYSDFFLLFLLIPGISKPGGEPEPQNDSIRPATGWSLPSPGPGLSPCPAQPCALGYGNKDSVHCCNQAVCHSPRLCIQRVPWTRIFNLAKKKQQPRSHCCLFSHFSPHPNQRPSGLVCPTARKTYRALCTAAFLAEHKTP